MAVIPVVHANSAVRDLLRRGVKRRARVLSCRSMRRVRALLAEELVDAIVVDVRSQSVAADAFELAATFPEVPIFACSAFRPDDGPLLSRCQAAGLHGVFVNGVDEPVLGEYVASRCATSRRRNALADAPQLLRLTEPVQMHVWNEILERVDQPTTTASLAGALGVSREHLSREFASGGAPNLKRVIDLARLTCAAHLLTNPGYNVTMVAHILRFSSASHLAGSARRIAGVAPSELSELGARGVLHRFRRGRMRSRLSS